MQVAWIIANIVTADVLQNASIKLTAMPAVKACSKVQRDRADASFVNEALFRQASGKLRASCVLPAKEVSRELAIDLEKTLHACHARLVHSASKASPFVNSQLRRVLLELQVYKTTERA
jgi:hypothetical protein